MIGRNDNRYLQPDWSIYMEAINLLAIDDHSTVIVFLVTTIEVYYKLRS